MTLDDFNVLPRAEALSEILRCCGSRRWAELMISRRPYSATSGLLQAADDVWNSLSPEDWKEAFSHHPKIGDIKNLKEKFAPTAQWASGEQAGVADAAEEVLQQLADGNRHYERKFGYIFIVCATGKSAGHILEMIMKRMGNDPVAELRLAAGEQAKITKLRLEKLCA